MTKANVSKLLRTSTRGLSKVLIGILNVKDNIDNRTMSYRPDEVELVNRLYEVVQDYVEGE